jgi:hypothetical protein
MSYSKFALCTNRCGCWPYIPHRPLAQAQQACTREPVSHNAPCLHSDCVSKAKTSALQIRMSAFLGPAHREADPASGTDIADMNNLN